MRIEKLLLIVSVLRLCVERQAACAGSENTWKQTAKAPTRETKITVGLPKTQGSVKTTKTARKQRTQAELNAWWTGHGRKITGRAIGIDLGSSYIRVGAFLDGRVEILANDQGSELTPSYVAFTASGHRLIGDEAKSQLATNPKNTVFSVMQLLGRNFDDELVQDHIKHVPYTVYSRSGLPAIDVKVGENAESFAPEEIVAMLLRKMKHIGERHLNETVTGAVISVPSCLTYVQRRAVRDAGKIAGFEEVHVVNSHMATALAYYANADLSTKTKILVFDLGGSSLSVTVMSISEGSIRTETQRGICGLGGDQFEQRVTEQMMKLFEKLRGQKLAQKLRQDTRAVQRLRREVEKAVRFLSSAELAYVEVESLIDGVDFSQALTRARFEELNMDLFRKSWKIVENLKIDYVRELVIVGGSTIIPMMRKNLKFFGIKESTIVLGAGTASATGAGIWAAILDGTIDRLIGSDFIITLADTRSQSLGYRKSSGLYEKVIMPSEEAPVEKFDEVRVASEEDEAVSSAVLLVYEGDESMAVNNSYLGSVSMNFPETVSSNVHITFTLDDMRVLNVTLEEMNTGVVKTVSFEHELSREDMIRMMRRLQVLEDIDRFETKRLEARDDLESMAYLIKREISKGMRLSGGLKTGDLARAETAALSVIDWLETNGDAEVGEFLMKRRQLIAAAQRFKL